MKIDNQAHGQFSAPGEVRLIRLLPGPIERVWQFLTDPAKRRRWFTDGPMELKPGGGMRLHFRHKNIAPDEVPPPDYAQYHDPGAHMDGTVLECEPPRLLRYTWGEGGRSDVTFELTPEGRQVRLVLTHRCRGDAVEDVGHYAVGWHTHLTILLALLADQPAPPFWGTHARLTKEYESRGR
ncbi:MAG TPA: SRPBCC family protein [Opitutaceae bacterium]|nr:SRPBCC family protein [Opitutaceae bacterium]